MATVVTIKLAAGEARRIRITAKDKAGAAIDLTGVSLTWILARAHAAPALVTKTVGAGITIIDPTGGVFEVDLVAADTAGRASDVYYHEAEMVETGARPTQVVRGPFIIEPASI